MVNTVVLISRKKNTCLFDNKVENINELLSKRPEYVTQISTNPLGDLSILLMYYGFLYLSINKSKTITNS